MVEDCLSPPIMLCMILLAQDKGQNDFSFKDGIGSASVVRRVLHRCGTTYDSSYILYILVRGKFRESFPARESGCLSGLSSLTSSILHQSCSKFHPQPHTSVGFHNPSVVQSSSM